MSGTSTACCARPVDVEFAGQISVQILIRDACGRLLIKRIVDHEMTVKELYEKAASNGGLTSMVLSVLNRFDEPPTRKLTKDCENASTLVTSFEEIE